MEFGPQKLVVKLRGDSLSECHKFIFILDSAILRMEMLVQIEITDNCIAI